MYYPNPMFNTSPLKSYVNFPIGKDSLPVPPFLRGCIVQVWHPWAPGCWLVANKGVVVGIPGPKNVIFLVVTGILGPRGHTLNTRVWLKLVVPTDLS